MSPRTSANADSSRSWPDLALKRNASNASSRKLAQRVGRFTSAICLSFMGDKIRAELRRSFAVPYAAYRGAAAHVSPECLDAVIPLLKMRRCGGNGKARGLRTPPADAAGSGRLFPSNAAVQDAPKSTARLRSAEPRSRYPNVFPAQTTAEKLASAPPGDDKQYRIHDQPAVPA